MCSALAAAVLAAWKSTDEGGDVMRNPEAGEKAAGRRGGVTSSTLAGVKLAFPRPPRWRGRAT